jgi:hypothetical protein
MNSLGLFDNSYFSYTGYQYETDSVEEDSLDKWLAVDKDIQSSVAAFELGMPYKCDSLADSEHNNHKLINQDFYTNAYWNIVVETHFKQQTIFLTEKTFKPILNMQPFVLAGNPYSLKMLKQLGYKTFNDVIDETYDTVSDPEERMRELVTVCYSIASRSNKDQLNMIAILEDTLEYNQKHFIQPKVQRIKNYLSKLEY